MKSSILILGGALVGLAVGLMMPKGVPHPLSNEQVTSHDGQSLPSDRSYEAGRTGGSRQKKISTEETCLSVPIESLKYAIRSDSRVTLDYRVDKEGNPSLGRLSEAFRLLDVSNDDATKILKLFDEISLKLRQQELRNVKVASVSDSQINLDATGMRAPVQALMEEAKSGILRILPDLKGQVLVDSLNWESFYRMEGFEEIKLGVSLTQSIELNPHEGRGNIVRAIELENHDLPNDGSPLPAERAFGPQWEPFLKGLSITPVKYFFGLEGK